MTIIPRPDPAFWNGKRVLVTGHTGFKGAWLSLWLSKMGAQVFGISLAPETDDALFRALDCFESSVIGDLRKDGDVAEIIQTADPEIVIHMAAQAFVRRSVADPLDTISSNVMGTAKLLDGLRAAKNLKQVLVITSDKVYANSDAGIAFTEDAPLGGHDPYSGSKAATEHIAHSYDMSYFRPQGVWLAVGRAGNVIGGGDWSEDRIIPDCMRALRGNTPLTLRHPEAVRPWQHVLDCLNGYLLYVEQLAEDGTVPRAMNFGPDASDRLEVGELVDLFYKTYGETAEVLIDRPEHSVEMKLLMIDPTLAHDTLGWRCSLSQRDAVRWTAEWYRETDPLAATEKQIDIFARTTV
ncbi:MAG: CDP-glucose 4,6-dehydratase [Pseudomonadota bacterium]